MKILIIYGTTEGQTRKIAENAAARIGNQGHEAIVHNADSVSERIDLAAFDAIIVAASVHQERHQDAVINFALAHNDQLNTKPTAFISVSLAAVAEQGSKDAHGYVDRFKTTTNWTPDKVLLLGGALRFTEYDYFKQQIVQHIVMKQGAAPSPERDYDFTDWDALAEFVDDVLEAASGR